MVRVEFVEEFSADDRLFFDFEVSAELLEAHFADDLGFGLHDLEAALDVEQLVLVESGPSGRELAMLENLEVGINQSFEKLAAFDTGQELIFQRREQVQFLFELVLSSDVGFAAKTAVFLTEEAKTLGLDSGVDLIPEVEEWKRYDGLHPGGKAFDDSEFVVYENTSILQE